MTFGIRALSHPVLPGRAGVLVSEDVILVLLEADLEVATFERVAAGQDRVQALLL